MTDAYTPDESLSVHGLARRGLLASFAEAATPEQRRVLNRDGYEIVGLLVFQHVTRPREFDRGHFRCTAGVHRLEPDCWDRFQDDVEAALTDLFRNAKQPIHNVEGWVRKRLTASTVNAHRRRRGQRGALQRPRLTRWLVEALRHDTWLQHLALEILEWVGIPNTAGTGIWPLTAWAGDRARITGEWDSTEQMVAVDVETVLLAMRRRPSWYEAYVERPLARKESPVLPAARIPADTPGEPPYLSFTEEHEMDDANLLNLATIATETIANRIAAGEPPRQVVENVIRTVFCNGTGVEDLGRLPGMGPTTDDQLDGLLADPAVLDRIVEVVLDIIDTDQP